MNGLNAYNVQGDYDQGRGQDGLSFVMPNFTSRYGTSTPMGTRPGYITGKPRPPASLDPAQVLPQVGARYTGRTDYTREELLKKFPPYSGPMATTSPITWDPKPKPFAALTDAEKRLRILGTPVRDQPKMSVGLIDPGKVVVVTPTLKPRIHAVPRRKTKPNKATKIRNRQAFINWIKNWAPPVYAAAKAKADRVEAAEATLGQLGGWWETFSDSISDLGGKYLQFRTQKEILEAQMERMRQGLPPLQTSEYAPTIAIKPDAGTTREITGAIGAGFGKMLPFIAIGGIALLLIMRRR